MLKSNAAAIDPEPAPAWFADPRRRAAFVVAHPGHELRLLDWMRAARPAVHILTNGSRAFHGRSRRDASEQIVRDAGCASGGAWHGVEDAALYACVMQGRAEIFEQLTTSLATALIARKPELVITDAWQQYNVVHDLTHLMTRIAAAEASQRLGREITVLDYLVVPCPLAPGALTSEAIYERVLAPDDVAQKQARTQTYPDIESELMEIEELEGDQAFAIERLYRPPSLASLVQAPAQKPAYEVYGEARVQTGRYTDVLRWRHVESVITQLMARYAKLNPLPEPS